MMRTIRFFTPDLRTRKFAAVLLLTAVTAFTNRRCAADSYEFPAEGDLQAASRQINELITSTVLDNIPHTFEDLRQWGMTSERWDGLKIEADGLRIKTKRRKKEVNHGTWKMYRVRLVDPENSFLVKVENVRDSGQGFLEFDVIGEAQLATFGRISKWVKGVQLFSFSADGKAKVQLRSHCQLAMNLDITAAPPDVVFLPTVKTAELKLLEFEVDRVSNVGGEVAEQIGRGIRSVLKDKIDDHEEKLVKKMNRQIAKNQDHFRLSLPDALTPKWAALTKQLID